MKAVCLFIVLAAGAISAMAQEIVVINDPTKPDPESQIGRAEEAVFRREALPAVHKKLESSACKESVEIAGVASGSFTRPDALQSLIFYQYCQTANGTGWVGLVLLERGTVIANLVSNSGWSSNIVKLPDIDQNGLDEFTLEYAGGFQPAHSDVFIEIWQFKNDVPLGMGRFTSEQNGVRSSSVWKVTAKTGKIPAFYRQKFRSGTDDTYRPEGGNLAFKLGKAAAVFIAIK